MGLGLPDVGESVEEAGVVSGDGAALQATAADHHPASPTPGPGPGPSPARARRGGRGRAAAEQHLHRGLRVAAAGFERRPPRRRVKAHRTELRQRLAAPRLCGHRRGQGRGWGRGGGGRPAVLDHQGVAVAYAQRRQPLPLPLRRHHLRREASQQPLLRRRHAHLPLNGLLERGQGPGGGGAVEDGAAARTPQPQPDRRHAIWPPGVLVPQGGDTATTIC